MHDKLAPLNQSKQLKSNKSQLNTTLATQNAIAEDFFSPDEQKPVIRALCHNPNYFEMNYY